jgi:antitoxin (DNA-binding transcriptional repressor) of toxin-antitoxin stability system
MVIKSMSAAAFKARCLTLMDVKETREPVVIAKRGQPVACISVGRRRSEYLGFIFLHHALDRSSVPSLVRTPFDHTQS